MEADTLSVKFFGASGFRLGYCAESSSDFDTASSSDNDEEDTSEGDPRCVKSGDNNFDA